MLITTGKYLNLNNSGSQTEKSNTQRKRNSGEPHLCDSEPKNWSRLQCGAAPAAEVDTVAGSEADTGVGTVACTVTEVEDEDEAEAEAEAWPLRGTVWKRLRRRWTSPGQCG